ncbi:hypothetical protein KGA66_03345 [Actinocrinis puniceicyclus]|uniref:Uncharacterized protein n=1 Tax=Actinocrinis puniceicyclus TaxID=977794 RepID=A0A8J7WLQ5_9ACTN|nr:hypothetical protein [Actinocrinis puniceicyclus]MBS2962069.1 hypothetical protein [Actinocrinis puniceicyclus]
MKYAYEATLAVARNTQHDGAPLQGGRASGAPTTAVSAGLCGGEVAEPLDGLAVAPAVLPGDPADFVAGAGG